jgi:hypothetical protein
VTAPAGADPDEVFVQYRPDRRRWLVAAALVAVVGLGFAMLYSVRTTVYSPAAVVGEYFDALAERDADAALAVIAPEQTAGLPRDLLTDAVLDSESYVPPVDPDVGEVTVDGRRAVAEVAFTLGGERRTASLRLHRDDGFLDAVFHRWRLAGGVQQMFLSEAPAEVSVNGERVVAYELDGPRTLPALWGGYEVGVPAGDPLWDSRTETVLVGPEGAAEAAVPMVARPGVAEEVERQVRQLLDECAASTELLPPGCPFGNARIAAAKHVRWRIASYPELGLSAAPDGFGQVAMLAVSTHDGTAVVTGTQLAFGTERRFETGVPFPVSGTVTERDDTVVFEPSW